MAAAIVYSSAVPEPFSVVIGSSELLPALKARAAGNGEVLAFSNLEALQALEVITTRRPIVVALERLFAATPRGAAFIHRMRADPNLVDVDIRVLAHDSDYSRVVPRAPRAAAQPLDQRGTRRAPRVKLAPRAEMLVDGTRASLIDLSTVGAQVVSAATIKPNQSVRLSFGDDEENPEFSGTVAWTSFEIPPGSAPRYRAGIAFVDADPGFVDGYCERHKA